MRFFENMTQQEIAQALGMNQMGVSRVLRRSLTRMKALSELGTPRAAV
jgi:DNA-directed RNA polymerase specialized sigma subunit